MNRKTLAQILLGLLIIISIIFSYLKFFNPEKKIVEIDKNQIEKSNKIETDQIEGLEYFSNDAQGNTYIVRAKSGKNESQDTEMITLYDVKAILEFDEEKKINVTSKKAIYNTINNDTEFQNDVLISFEDHNISCDKIIAKFSENYAKLVGNLVYNSTSIKFYADQMNIDLINRTTKTYMLDKNDKIKVIKHNGIN